MRRRLMCGLYDGLFLVALVALVALLLVAALPFLALTQKLDPDWARRLLQP